ncbi:MAG: SUMF1/EgtB/PvdO family nonheme iron enzyme [Verrucomicrobia bacterium]|nr:SUMF1/EgtB/PvdO family nonheme iron enzyme [Verrucomicrobiota bacterium]
MPSKTPRPDPVIPDHEMLRKIGGGAYGEVWLGRGVTGAMRAVKVVWREDFDDERGFEREFEGILKFEPISRDHPGLVNILHVGRGSNAGGAFYYYVMELGDDVRNGQDINPVEYEPRTLRPDAKTSTTVKLELAECVSVGLRLAEALGHLHERGLAHRDVKPSNVIFVNGKAKLADIGLVAARGQRTFVGTEGFVPPEGPGSTQADVYSLGKVLYEIATGKDRLDFPELPDEIPDGSERKRWLELNRIICDICEPRVSKRRITTAADLAEALRLLQRGKRRRRGMAGAVWLTSAVLLGFSGWVGWNAIKDSGWQFPHPVVETLPDPEPPPPAKGRLLLVTNPGDADVLDEDGQYLGTTPTTLEGDVGTVLRFTLRKAGYREETLEEKVDEGAVDESKTIYRELQVFRPPEIGDAWLDLFGNSYQPVNEEHIGFSLVEEADWKRFATETKRPADAGEIVETTQNGEPSKVVVCPLAEAEAYCAWFRDRAVKAGYLTEDHEVVPVMETAFDAPGLSERARAGGFKPFRVKVRLIDYATLELTSAPPGADVYLNGSAAGSTDETLVLGKIPPGDIEIIIVKEGFKPYSAKVGLKPGQKFQQLVRLVQNQGVVFGKTWDNGIGMRFEPLGGDLMVSAWETRVKDYEVFVRETGHAPAPPPGFPQGPDHPVVFVSRDDANAFCEWLTQRERKPGEDRITVSQLYRLPTDLEWSAMVGLSENHELSPSWRDAHKAQVFPWGDAWPPPAKCGNLADSSAAATGGIVGEKAIAGYDDGFAGTSPVGSFPANELKLFDLAGNVYEWVADDNSPLDRYRLGVLRGGSWTTFRRDHLYSGARYPQPAKAIADIYGFRVVLARVPPKPEPAPADEDPDAPEESAAEPASSKATDPGDGKPKPSNQP